MICDPDNLDTDFYLFRDGPVVVTCDRSLWELGSKWLVDPKGYTHHSWTLNSKDDFFNEVSRALGWEKQFGYEKWNGNLDALNDGALSCPFESGQHIVITIDNADRLNNWFGPQTAILWEIFKDASRMQLLFGTGLLFLVYSSSCSETKKWAEKEGVFELRSNSFPGAQLIRDANRK